MKTQQPADGLTFVHLFEEKSENKIQVKFQFEFASM